VRRPHRPIEFPGRLFRARRRISPTTTPIDSFLELYVEEVDVVHELAIEEPIELFRVDQVGPFDLPIQPGCGGLDMDVADACIEQVPVKDLSEFLAVVGLDLLNFELQLRKHMVDEPDRGLLVMGRVSPQDAQAGAVIDRGVLVVPLFFPVCPSGSMNFTPT
jgi:hypothetical protein